MSSRFAANALRPGNCLRVARRHKSTSSTLSNPSSSQPQPTVAQETVVPSSYTAKQLTGIYAELSKARLSALVVASTSAGFLLAGAPIAVDSLVCVTVGTSLAAASANTFNQLYEVKTDLMMNRTCRRPLPSGRISRAHAAAFGVGTAVSSTAILAAGCNPLTAGLGLANIALYAGVYTPLKQFHTANTWVGAVVGAIPPLMGYAAATGTIFTPEAGIISAGLFLWQFPHFFSLAWLMKKDYAAGGHHMVPCFDKTGARTAQILMRYSLAMSTLPFAATALGVTSSMFAVESVLFNGYLLHACNQFRLAPGNGNARKVFRCSLWYLPLFMSLLVFHKNDWGNPSGSGTITVGSNEWTKARPEQDSFGIEHAIQKTKQTMRELCVHEKFFPPANGEPQETTADLLSSEQSPNPFCPVSTTKTKIDDCTEQAVIRAMSQPSSK